MTFCFADGTVALTEGVPLTATVSSAEYPELFEEKYMTVPKSYIVQLAIDNPFQTDLDGDGDLEKLEFHPCLHENGLLYQSFTIYSDAETECFKGNYYADKARYTGGYHPYYVNNGDGRHYLYVFTDGSEFASSCMELVVIELTNGKFKEIGNMNIATGYISADLSYALTDPENMMLENYETQTETTAYRVGQNGMSELKQ